MGDKDAIIAALVSALRPFALAATMPGYENSAWLRNGFGGAVKSLYGEPLTVGHLRAAADALRATGHDIEGGDA